MVDFILGSEEDFDNFLNSIDPELDKVLIISHTDLDGISSALFMEKILEFKKISSPLIIFSNGKISKEDIEKYKNSRITKVFVLDLPLESTDKTGFDLIRKNFDVLEIDHHPFERSLEKEKNILKTVSSDCVGLTMFRLSVDYGLNEKEWAWLACAVAFSEFSYNKKDNFDFIQSYYSDFVSGNFPTSTPGLNARKISSSLAYYENDIRKVYDLVKAKNLDELAELKRIIEEEIDRKIETFFDNAEFFPEKKLYFYHLDSPYNIKSYFTTAISSLKKDFSFVVYSNKGDKVVISARNQSKNADMNFLMRKSIEGLENASGGGHSAAAGAVIQKKDLDLFKTKLLENI